MSGDPCEPLRADLTQAQRELRELQATLASGIHLTAGQKAAIKAQIARRTRQVAALGAALQRCVAGAGENRGDPTFGGNGEIVLAADPMTHVTSVLGAVIQAHGRIVAVAEGGPGHRLELVGYDPQTERNDPAFAMGGIAVDDLDHTLNPAPINWYAKGFAVQPDGKIVVAGWGALGGPGSSSFPIVVARYTPDGHPDEQFGSHGHRITPLLAWDGDGSQSTVDVATAYAIAVQPDDKIVVAGSAWQPFRDATHHGFANIALVRYLPTGDLDTAFGTEGMVTVDSVPGTGLALALQPDGGIVVAGSDTAESRFVIARYTADGRLDTTFGVGGAVSTDFAGPGTIGLDAGATAVIVLSDGRIVAVGPVRYLRIPNTGVELVDVGVARYLPDGRPDTALNGTGHILVDLDPHHAPHRLKAVPSTAPVAAVPDPPSTAGDDATLLLGAGVQLTTAGTPLNAVITRLRPDGTTDPAFFVRRGDADIGSLTLDPQGRVIACGRDFSQGHSWGIALSRYTQ